MATRRPQSSGPTRDVIRSSSNQIVRYVRSLQRRSTRHEERAFVVEGVRAVLDALDAGAVPSLLIVREGDEHVLPQPAAGFRVVAPDLFATLTDTVHPQGILGIFPFAEREPELRGPALYLIADRIGDPGNLGTLLRSAAAAAATAVVLMPETVDPYNPKVVRAAMGAHFRIPLLDYPETLTAQVIERTQVRVLADLGDHLAYNELDWTNDVAVIVASETAGPSDLARSLTTDRITIPMANAVESLNAGVAGSILLFEAARQRRAAAAHR
jgi:TrmH family RNA methyltransferase